MAKDASPRTHPQRRRATPNAETLATGPQAEQINRLYRLAGQVHGIARMIEEGRSAEDILVQFKAVRSALGAVEVQVVDSAIRSGLERALQSQDREELTRKLEELIGLKASSDSASFPIEN